MLNIPWVHFVYSKKDISEFNFLDCALINVYN